MTKPRLAVQVTTAVHSDRYARVGLRSNTDHSAAYLQLLQAQHAQGLGST